MSDYERIKSACLIKGELWKDPYFPATQPSVFYHQTPPFEFVWKRPKDIYANPKFILDNSEEIFDVVPGKLGDKWLASCLGVLYLHKGLLYRVVPADQRIDSSYAGIFRFRLWWCGQWLEVLVDDQLPTVNGKLVFMQTTHTEQLWPALLEKAYAKLHGSYEALKYGSLLDGLADLTGGITESFVLAEDMDPSILVNLLKTTSVVTAHYFPLANEIKIKSLELEMNYRIYNIEKVDTKDGPTYVVRLRRPLAPEDTPFTHVILDHATWDLIPMYERDRLSAATHGFWMLYSDFQRVFTRVEVVHLDAETSRAEATLGEKRKWQMKMHQGGWMRGVSAGGCRNFASTSSSAPAAQSENSNIVEVPTKTNTCFSPTPSNPSESPPQSPIASDLRVPENLSNDPALWPQVIPNNFRFFFDRKWTSSD